MGRPIAQHQLIQAKLADMETECEAARGLLYRFGQMVDEGADNAELTKSSAMAKLKCGDVAMAVMREVDPDWADKCVLRGDLSTGEGLINAVRDPVKKTVRDKDGSTRTEVVDEGVADKRLLVDSGTTIVKIFLHISKDEQKERLQARLDDPAKQWKFDVQDLEERKRWDDYRAAFEDAISETSTEDAPWYVIPANNKWYRNWAVLRILIETLERMDPQWPEPEDDLSGVVIE